MRVAIGLAACLAVALGASSCGNTRAAPAPRTPSALPSTRATTPPPASVPASARPRTLPHYAHVVVALLENHGRSQVLGTSAAPFLSALATGGADFASSFAIEHPSQPNYLDLFSGSNQGVRDDSCPHVFTADNLAHQLFSARLTFRAYAEDLPSAGSSVCSSRGYARKHAPWTDFADLAQRTVAQPYSAFPSALASLPTLAWVIPNLCDDMHDCSVATGDAWARTHLSRYAAWARAHNSLLVVTFDEDEGAEDNRITTIFYGAHVRSGRYSERIDHFTVLRTLEAIFGLPGLGEAAHRHPVTDAFAHG